MRFDPIRAVEACYAPARDEAWYDGLVEALDPLDRGHGLYCAEFDASDPGRVQLWPRCMRRPSPEWSARAQAAHHAHPAVLRALYWRHPPVGLASERLRALSSGAVASQRGVIGGPGGIANVLGIFALETDERGLMIGVPWTAGRLPSPRLRHQLSLLAAHLVSARRLRRAAAGEEPEAILDPDGKVQHAQGAAVAKAARERLSAAARRIEWARGRARRVDPEAALAVWRGLVDGSWSLLDRVDRDGRRFLLARRNAPGVKDPRALGPRERDVLAYAALGRSNKHIAYLLGLATSTVSSHLASAQRKLGLASRRELMGLFSPAPLTDVGDGRPPREGASE